MIADLIARLDLIDVWIAGIALYVVVTFLIMRRDDM